MEMGRRGTGAIRWGERGGRQEDWTEEARERKSLEREESMVAAGAGGGVPL
jgi:hypothetical protein